MMKFGTANRLVPGGFSGINLHGNIVFPPSSLSSTRRTVSCGADPRRIGRVGREIQREMGDLLVNDRNVLAAIDPKYDDDDIRNMTIASVTEVQMSRDLSVAKLYLMFSGGTKKSYQPILDRLNAKKGYIRRVVSQRLNLRRSPELVFYEDNTLNEADEMKRIMAVLREDREFREKQLAEQGTNMDEFLNSSSPPSSS
eukprot:jgi/Bigna1/136727/aug1.35_g11435